MTVFPVAEFGLSTTNLIPWSSRVLLNAAVAGLADFELSGVAELAEFVLTTVAAFVVEAFDDEFETSVPHPDRIVAEIKKNVFESRNLLIIFIQRGSLEVKRKESKT
ncbi:MAG: hypothetical protein K1X36_03350 [Pyrinomonadaceae bacterium]|nr:hypothetical protein [Pyrinomonadaceae bacterium]